MDCPVERVVVDRDVGERTDDDVLDFPVSKLTGREKHALIGFDLCRELCDDVVVMTSDCFPQVCDLNLRIVAEKEIHDFGTPFCYRQMEGAPGLVVAFEIDVGTRILEETLESDNATLLRRPADRFVDGMADRGMRACEDLFRLVHAVVADEQGEKLGFILHLNLAKHDIVVGRTIHGTQRCCDFREIECNELAYELHVSLIHFRTNNCVFL